MEKREKFTFIIYKYLIVGLGAAAVHGITLILLYKYISLPLSNLIGFLTASITSYLGHALFTFRSSTKGKRFAKRWLAIQYIINICISLFLPLILERIISGNILRYILIFTPTLINAIIWRKAKNYSSKRNFLTKNPLFHADDFGLTDKISCAIVTLMNQNRLDSTSIMVNGYSVDLAIALWEKNNKFPLGLHLCLTEGPTISKKQDLKYITNNKGLMNISFVKLLLTSMLPRMITYREKIKQELKSEIIAQIERFLTITKLSTISLDGHQHVHLIPIILEIILELKDQYNIQWIRTTQEPIPSGISLTNWGNTISNGGVIKWLILQILTKIAKPKIKQAYIKTNKSFSGILFTGRMTNKIMLSSMKEFELLKANANESLPIVLIHPAYTHNKEEINNNLKDFKLSRGFFQSKWRKIEFDNLRSRKLHVMLNQENKCDE